MDRHQYVAKLTKERDELLTQKGKLQGERSIAYSRSVTRFRDLLKEPVAHTITTRGCCTGEGIAGCVSGIRFVQAEPNVNDDYLKTLCIEIGSLQKECEALQAEINSLQTEDFIALIAPLLPSNK